MRLVCVRALRQWRGYSIENESLVYTCILILPIGTPCSLAIQNPFQHWRMGSGTVLCSKLTINYNDV